MKRALLILSLSTLQVFVWSVSLAGMASTNHSSKPVIQAAPKFDYAKEKAELERITKDLEVEALRDCEVRVSFETPGRNTAEAIKEQCQ
jgi:hypothetical protein